MKKVKDKIKHRFCGYCGQYKQMTLMQFMKHQSHCEKDRASTYKRKR